MEVWVFLAKNITKKPASQYHPGALAVKYNQAQKCLQDASNKLLQKFYLMKLTACLLL